MPDKWELARVLPNLRIPPAADDHWHDGSTLTGRRTLTLRGEDVAIVPGDDPRVLAFCEEWPSARRLLDAFRTPYSKPILPAALIVRAASKMPRRLDAVAAFRNAVTACFVPRARAGFLAEEDHNAGASWSDLFDFHPAEIDRQGRVAIHTAALLHAMGHPKSLSFAGSPAIDHQLDLRRCDEKLSVLCARAWRDAFVRQRLVRQLRPIFRSLEVAYQAGAVPEKNIGSLSDFGLSVAHWVSALEVLLWPINGHANQVTSITYLGLVRWDDRALDARRYKWGNPPVRINAIQKSCHLIYRARNRFLHGEPVAQGALRIRWRGKHVHLPALAPIVFRTALLHRLEGVYGPVLTGIEPEDIMAWMTESLYRKALRRALGLKKSRPRGTA